MPKIPKGGRLTIERGRGATYANNDFVVYEHTTYPRTSVLAGQPCRKWIDSFATLEEAKTKFPTAVECVGTTYQPPSLNHLPDDGDY
jgi:hypothetical protein